MTSEYKLTSKRQSLSLIIMKDWLLLRGKGVTKGHAGSYMWRSRVEEEKPESHWAQCVQILEQQGNTSPTIA